MYIILLLLFKYLNCQEENINPYPIPEWNTDQPITMITTKCWIWKRRKVTCADVYENEEIPQESWAKLKVNIINQKLFESMDKICSCDLDNEMFLLDKKQQYLLYYRDNKIIFQNKIIQNDFLITEKEQSLDCYLCILRLHSKKKN